MFIFEALVRVPVLEREFIDGSIIKAPQHSVGAVFEENQAIEKSVGGTTTKIHMTVDAHRLPLDIEITGAEVHDCKIAPKFIEKLPVADMDWELYQYRHLVENLLARIKHFKGLSTRFDRLKRNYVSVIAMACVFLWLPMGNVNTP